MVDPTTDKFTAIRNRIWKLARGKIVSLGCGECPDLYDKEPMDYTGIDILEPSLDIAKQKYPFAKFIHCDLRQTNLPSHEFDTVLMIGCLDAFNNFIQPIQEARRLVKEDGIIIATVFNENVGFGDHKWMTIEEAAENLGFRPKHHEHIIDNDIYLLIL